MSMTETDMLQCLTSFVIPGVAELEKSYKKLQKVQLVFLFS